MRGEGGKGRGGEGLEVEGGGEERGWKWGGKVGWDG